MIKPYCFRGSAYAIQQPLAAIQIDIARMKWCPVLLKYEPANDKAVAVHSVLCVLILVNILILIRQADCQNWLHVVSGMKYNFERVAVGGC